MFAIAAANPLPAARDNAVTRLMPMSPADQPIAALYPQLRSGLLAFLRKLTGDREVAEDLLHDVMLKALAAGDAEKSVLNPVGWLYAVARNTAMDHHRRSRPSEELSDDIAAEPADDDEAMAELAACLRPAAMALPETYRATVIAAELEGRSLAEIAAELGLSLSAVKQRASRGRRLLRDQMVQCCSIALSAQGTVLDFDGRQVANCNSSCAPSARAPRCR